MIQKASARGFRFDGLSSAVWLVKSIERDGDHPQADAEAISPL